MTYTIRRVRPDDWPAVKALRLHALQDPVAHVAFLETYEAAVARPDEFWQERAARAAEGEQVSQLLAETEAGELVGMLTLLVTHAGEADYTETLVDVDQAAVVGVFVHAAHRGAGLIDRLIEEGAAWAREVGARRLRLHVHSDNPRAQAAYRRSGFADSGRRVDLGHGDEVEMDRPLRAEPGDSSSAEAAPSPTARSSAR